MLNPLDFAKRHRVYLDGRVLPDPTGRILLADDDVLRAMDQLCQVVLDGPAPDEGPAEVRFKTRLAIAKIHLKDEMDSAR